MESANNAENLPKDTKDTVKKATQTLISQKSAERYKKEFLVFEDWQGKEGCYYQFSTDSNFLWRNADVVAKKVNIISDKTLTENHKKSEHSKVPVEEKNKSETASKNTKENFDEYQSNKKKNTVTSSVNSTNNTDELVDNSIIQKAVTSMEQIRANPKLVNVPGPLELFCERCGLPFPTVKELLIHLKNKYTPFNYDHIYKCHLCDSEFIPVLSTFEDHVKKHSLDILRKAELLYEKNKLTTTHHYFCIWCGKGYSNLFKYQDHLKSHLPNKMCLPCPDCDARFTTLHVLVAHQKKVHSLKMYQFQCEKCPDANMFYNTISLRNHIKTKHNTEDATKSETVFCECCGKKFINFGALLNHIYDTFDKQFFQCMICKEKIHCFARNLTLHYEHVHKLDNPYEAEVLHKLEFPNKKRVFCSKCGVGFGNVFEYTSHNNHDHLKQLTQCHKCDEAFVGLPALVNHIKGNHSVREIVKDNVIYCSKCPEISFASKTTFKHHRNTIHKYRVLVYEPPKLKIEQTIIPTTITKVHCETCGSLVDNIKTLIEHIRKNYKDHVFRCQVKTCNKQISPFTKNLNIHYSAQHAPQQVLDADAEYRKLWKPNEKSHYYCSVCGKGFPGATNYFSHKTNHSVEVSCSECNESFAELTHLVNHFGEKHTGCAVLINDSISCSKCTHLRFSNKNEYLLHKEAVHFFKEGLTVFQEIDSKRHKKNKFICPICNGGFANEIGLATHTNSHFNDQKPKKKKKNKMSETMLPDAKKRKIENLICNKCYKSFDNRQSFEAHKNNNCILIKKSKEGVRRTPSSSVSQKPWLVGSQGVSYDIKYPYRKPENIHTMSTRSDDPHFYDQEYSSRRQYLESVSDRYNEATSSTSGHYGMYGERELVASSRDDDRYYDLYNRQESRPLHKILEESVRERLLLEEVGNFKGSSRQENILSRPQEANLERSFGSFKELSREKGDLIVRRQDVYVESNNQKSLRTSFTEDRYIDRYHSPQSVEPQQHIFETTELKDDSSLGQNKDFELAILKSLEALRTQGGSQSQNDQRREALQTRRPEERDFDEYLDDGNYNLQHQQDPERQFFTQRSTNLSNEEYRLQERRKRLQRELEEIEKKSYLKNKQDSERLQIIPPHESARLQNADYQFERSERAQISEDRLYGNDRNYDMDSEHGINRNYFEQDPENKRIFY